MKIESLEEYFLDVLQHPKKYSNKLHLMAMKFAVNALEDYRLGKREYDPFLVCVFGPRR